LIPALDAVLHLIGAILLIVGGIVWAFIWFILAVFSTDTEDNRRVGYELLAVAAIGPVAIACGIWLLT
jgi:hypothetical protein